MKQDIYTVFVADDHQIMLDGLTGILQSDPAFRLCGTAKDGKSAWQSIQQSPPDILIADIQMPDMNGIELCRLVTSSKIKTKVLVLSMFNDNTIIGDAIEAGAMGYLLKNTGKSEFLTALHTLIRDEKYFDREVLETIMNNLSGSGFKETGGAAKLTPRELEIIHLIVDGKSTAYIADTLFISPRTVETHRKNIFRKTQTHNVAQLIKYAYNHSLTA